MDRIKHFFIWLDCTCPKPIRWLLYALIYIIGILFHLVLAELIIFLFVLVSYTIPEKLQVLGDMWANIIEWCVVFPLSIAAFLGIGCVYVKIVFGK